MSTKIVYIMGYGRSGSTVLDVTLGTHPQLKSVGELGNLVTAGLINGEYCSCGRPVNKCPTWLAVKRDWLSRTDLRDVESFRVLQDRVEKSPFRWLVAFQSSGNSSGLVRDYVGYLSALYESIRTVSGRAVIVDSTKDPFRALMLSQISNVELKVIHLVRDVRGVAWSLMKAYRRDDQAGVQHDISGRPPWNTALRWTAKNAQSELVKYFLGNDAWLLVRYEDFVNDTNATLRKLGEFIEFDLSCVASSLKSGQALPVGCKVAGNRVRMQSDIRIKPDLEWQASMSCGEKRKALSVASWLMRSYGYRH